MGREKYINQPRLFSDSVPTQPTSASVNKQEERRPMLGVVLYGLATAVGVPTRLAYNMVRFVGKGFIKPFEIFNALGSNDPQKQITDTVLKAEVEWDGKTRKNK